MRDEEVEVEVGTIIVATGFEPFDASKKPELAYANYPNVITGLEFERLVSASGPTKGEILIEGKEPKQVVFIQCVGSRDKKLGNEWCSRVCCMYATKQAHLVREKIPDAQVTVLYMDLRAFGKGCEEFYDRVRSEGVLFRRANGSEVYRQGDRLVVRTEDTLLGKTVEIPADLVVLSAGIEPGEGTKSISKLLKLSTSADGFLNEAHLKLRPVDTTTDGIYLAGCCQAPKDIPDTVAQAKAAAASAIIPIVRGKVISEPIVSRVDEDICSGCRECESVCEYKAITYDERKNIVKVNQTLCKGCGCCAVACRSGAILIKHFTDRQVLAQLDALLSS
jgi:heterodisulfide reductase subunit A